jgi:hypothetical protein
LLTINGPGLLNVANFTLGSGDDSVISSGGKMLVRNNLTLSNQSTMSVNGVLVVKGTFDTANNGNITIDGTGAFSAQGPVNQGNNTIDPSLPYCVAADPCGFPEQNPHTKCNKVCIALGGFPGNGGSTTLPITLVNFSVMYEQPLAVENRNQPKFGFNLVPNPGNGQQLNLALKGEGIDQVLISVYGSLGQMVYESVASGTDGRQVNIQLRQSLPNGIYWVKVRKGNETVTRQMLVSHL